MFGGYDSSVNIQQHFRIPGAFPVVSTISGPLRSVCSVGLVAFNAFQALAFTAVGLAELAYSKGQSTVFLELAGGSLKAMALNIACIAFGIFEAIPGVGTLCNLEFIIGVGTNGFPGASDREFRKELYDKQDLWAGFRSEEFDIVV